jgi:hypothetical protein
MSSSTKVISPVGADGERDFDRRQDRGGLLEELRTGDPDRPVVGAKEELVACSVALEGPACAVRFPAVGFGDHTVLAPEEVGVDRAPFEVEGGVDLGGGQARVPDQLEEVAFEVVAGSLRDRVEG